MKSRYLLLIRALVILLPISTLPQSVGQTAKTSMFRTYGELNGRAWRVSLEESKLAYLEGMDAAFETAYGRSLKTSCEKQTALLLDAYRMAGFNGGEQVAAVDRFYAEPANLLIAIVDAVEISVAKARGVPQDVIDSRVAEHRRVANAAPERK